MAETPQPGREASEPRKSPENKQGAEGSKDPRQEAEKRRIRDMMKDLVRAGIDKMLRKLASSDEQQQSPSETQQQQQGQGDLGAEQNVEAIIVYILSRPREPGTPGRRRGGQAPPSTSRAPRFGSFGSESFVRPSADTQGGPSAAENVVRDHVDEQRNQSGQGEAHPREAPGRSRNNTNIGDISGSGRVFGNDGEVWVNGKRVSGESSIPGQRNEGNASGGSEININGTVIGEGNIFGNGARVSQEITPDGVTTRWESPSGERGESRAGRGTGGPRGPHGRPMTSGTGGEGRGRGGSAPYVNVENSPGANVNVNVTVQGERRRGTSRSRGPRGGGPRPPRSRPPSGPGRK